MTKTLILYGFDFCVSSYGELTYMYMYFFPFRKFPCSMKPDKKKLSWYLPTWKGFKVLSFWQNIILRHNLKLQPPQIWLKPWYSNGFDILTRRHLNSKWIFHNWISLFFNLFQIWHGSFYIYITKNRIRHHHHNSWYDWCIHAKLQ